MSIASEITRLQGVKSDILQAIADKGVTVPAGSALDDCPGLIGDIEQGGGDNSFFKVPATFYKNTKVSAIEDKLTAPWNVSLVGNGGFWFSEPIQLASPRKIEIQITFLLVSGQTAPSADVPILNYGAPSGDYADGRVCRFFVNATSGDVMLDLPNGKTAWINRVTFSGESTLNRKTTIKIVLDIDGSNSKAHVTINGHQQSDISFSFDSTIYQPTFFSEAIYPNYGPYTYMLNNGSCLFMSESYIKIDDVVYLGCEPYTERIGDKKYKCVKMPDGKVWMAENLDYKWSGLTVGSSASSSEARANYYNNDEATYGWGGNKYGLLYNYPAVQHLDNNKSTLIPGWHVPTSSELNTLMTSTGSAPAKLMATSWGGTDNYGFSLLPAGYTSDGNSFVRVGERASILSSTPYSNGPWILLIYQDYIGLSTTYSNQQFSIRLVKD